ncbi:hypothetical protein [Cellvibrio sp. pealriver]|uniref:hypothetical protein n=1 Tax=Cellvibrio sp. pealriver TaxID=1622269 RepID=UPI000A46547B|nr:hypothetical protein [Cellvibrio sp. pealriver]
MMYCQSGKALLWFIHEQQTRTSHDHFFLHAKAKDFLRLRRIWRLSFLPLNRP